MILVIVFVPVLVSHEIVSVLDFDFGTAYAPDAGCRHEVPGIDDLLKDIDHVGEPCGGDVDVDDGERVGGAGGDRYAHGNTDQIGLQVVDRNCGVESGYQILCFASTHSGMIELEMKTSY